jgi:hypothetical protein
MYKRIEECLEKNKRTEEQLLPPGTPTRADVKSQAVS